jgi:hypothetical protein
MLMLKRKTSSRIPWTGVMQAGSQTTCDVLIAFLLEVTTVTERGHCDSTPGNYCNMCSTRALQC